MLNLVTAQQVQTNVSVNRNCYLPSEICFLATQLAGSYTPDARLLILIQVLPVQLSGHVKYQSTSQRLMADSCAQCLDCCPI